MPEDESRVILATGSYIGEGFDDARLDTLFLAMPISWKGTLQQYVGRLHRLHDNKRIVQVYDYVDHYVPMLADIVLADAHPADRDFWQSAKGVYSGTMAVRDAGSLILVAPNPEGVAANHPNLLEIGHRPHKEIIRMVEAGEISDVVGAAILGDVAQILDKADCIMVSPGITREDTERLGFRYTPTAQRTLEMAFERQVRSASVAVLRQGGHILPAADGEAKRLEAPHAA